MERAEPYRLIIELARGKINQVRTQLAEWTLGGLLMPDTLTQEIHEATRALGQALVQLPDATADVLAERALNLAHRAAHQLARHYSSRVLELRHQRESRLATAMSCRVEDEGPTGTEAARFAQAFNTATLPISWQQVEPSSGHYCWDDFDRRVEWAQTQGLHIIGGPLVDFGGRNLPDWLWDCHCDLSILADRLTKFADAVVRRYHSRIRTWQITAGSNCAGILASRDEELIWLTLRIADTVRRANPQMDMIVGLAQPWGDYLAEQEHSKTPFIFADDLLRTGIKLAALDLEFVMAISPRGSYCRDLLDASRVLDLYALLGVPIQTTLGYPSSSAMLLRGDPDQRVNLGNWCDGYSHESQADWAACFATLALCKPFVRSVQWTHWSDASPHAFPNCGLVDESGREKPALEALAKVRSEHLR
jgi:hypothetical protein